MSPFTTPSIFADATDDVVILVLLARQAVQSIQQNFPVKGYPWALAGLPDGRVVVNEVLTAFTNFERAWNPTGAPFDDQCRQPFRLRQPGALLLDRPEVVRALVALESLIDNYSALVQHYGWARVVCAPNDLTVQPWTWPNVPPVDGGLLAAWMAAADELERQVTPNPLLVALAGWPPAGPEALHAAGPSGPPPLKGGAEPGRPTRRRRVPDAEVMPAAACDTGLVPKDDAAAGGSKLGEFEGHPVRVTNKVVDVRIVGDERAEGPRPQRPCIISLGKRTYQIGDGRPVVVLPQYDDILQAFLRQPAMDERQLVTTSGYDDAVKILRQLAEWEDGLFAPAIDLPAGKNRGGYHANVQKSEPSGPIHPPNNPCKR